MYQDREFKQVRRPKTVGCYICGRQYGTASILIHVKSCQKKWDIQESHKPKRQRRACPRPPPGFLEKLGKKKVKQSDLDEMNILAFENYNEQALLKCQHCERSFNPQSYQIHKKMCFADKPFMPLNKSVNKKPRQSNENNNYNTQSRRQQTPTKKSYGRVKQQPQSFKKNNYQSKSQTPQQQNIQTYKESEISKKEIFDKRKYQKTKTPVYISQGVQTLESSLKNNSNKYESNHRQQDKAINQKTNTQKSNNNQYRNLNQKNNYNSKPKKNQQQLKNEAALDSFIAQHFTQKTQKSKKSQNKSNNKKVKQQRQQYPTYDEQEYEQPVLLGMERCRKCNRTFASDRIDKHQSVCLGNKKPKKVKRFHKPPPKKKIAREKAQLKSKWRDQHKEFQANLKYMRKMKQAEEQGIALSFNSLQTLWKKIQFQSTCKT